MKKTFFIICVLACGLQQFIFCQDRDIERYNTLVNPAEMHIVNGNYCKAKDLYVNLAKKFQPFTTDLINGLIASLECDLHNIESIEVFVRLLFEIGAPIEYFETEFIKYSYFSSERWNVLKKIKPEFDRNNRYIQLVNKMLKIDQAGRGYNNMDSMEWADFKIYMMIQELSREINGFLGPEQLGFDYEPLGYSSNRKYSVLLVHQIKSRPYQWGVYLPRMYLDGLIDPRSFAFYYLLAEPCNKLELSCFPYPPENVIRVGEQIYICSGEIKERINMNREFFFLDSVEDQINKAFYRDSTDKPFRIGRSIPMYNLPPNEDPTELIKDLQELGFKKYSN